MKAVILAAGKGVRMRPLTNKIPKAMVKLKDKPMLQWTIERLVEAGIDEIGIVVGYKKEVIKEYFGEEFRGARISYIYQHEQKGTADAIEKVKGFVGDESFIVASCDVIVESSVYSELKDAGDEFRDWSVIVVGREVEDPWRYGVLVVKENVLKDIIEKPGFGEIASKIINAGVYRFDKKIFSAIDKVEKSYRGEHELTDAIKLIAKEEKVKVVMCKGECLDIGDLEDLKKAEANLKK